MLYEFLKTFLKIEDLNGEIGYGNLKYLCKSSNQKDFELNQNYFLYKMKNSNLTLENLKKNITVLLKNI